MTRDEFFAEVARRGYPRAQLFLRPGPDADRDPDGGGVVIDAPSVSSTGTWRTFRLDRGVRDEASFDEEADAYEHVLRVHVGVGQVPSGPATRGEFLAEVEAAGGRASWFTFRDAPGDPSGREGQVVIDRTGSGVVTYRLDRGRRDETVFATERDAWREILSSLPGRR